DHRRDPLGPVADHRHHDVAARNTTRGQRPGQRGRTRGDLAERPLAPATVAGQLDQRQPRRIGVLDDVAGEGHDAAASTICVQTKFAANRSPLYIRTSHTCVRRPRCSGSPTAVSTSPASAAANTLVLISTVVKFSPGPRFAIVPNAATVSPNA